MENQIIIDDFEEEYFPLIQTIQKVFNDLLKENNFFFRFLLTRALRDIIEHTSQESKELLQAAKIEKGYIEIHE